MMNTKKIISASSALIVTGVSVLSSVSAMSMESGNGTMSISNGTENTMSSGTMSNGFNEADTGSVNMGDVNKIKDPYNQCLAYTKLKNITWVDCKAKAEEMKQGNQAGRAQLNQGIKDDKMKMQQENQQNRQMMGSGQVLPPGEMNAFFKNPLTPDEKLAFKALMDAHQTARETIMKDATLTPVEKAAKMKELMIAHFADLSIYIAPDKQEVFKKATEEMLAMITKSQGLRQENQANRQEFKDNTKEKRQDFKTQVQAKKQTLSDKNKELLTKAVNTLSLEKLQIILAKVEKILLVSKKEKVVAQLNEIGDMIQNKIDELTGTSSEDTIVSDILGNDTTTNSSTTTSTVTQ